MMREHRWADEPFSGAASPARAVLLDDIFAQGVLHFAHFHRPGRRSRHHFQRLPWTCNFLTADFSSASYITSSGRRPRRRRRQRRLHQAEAEANAGAAHRTPGLDAFTMSAMAKAAMEVARARAEVSVRYNADCRLYRHFIAFHAATPLVRWFTVYIISLPYLALCEIYGTIYFYIPYHGTRRLRAIAAYARH